MFYLLQVSCLSGKRIVFGKLSRLTYTSTPILSITTMSDIAIHIYSSMDLTMTELQNSHERELDDWAKVFELADPRFKFQGGKHPAGANLWLLVAEWKGDE